VTDPAKTLTGNRWWAGPYALVAWVLIVGAIILPAMVVIPTGPDLLDISSELALTTGHTSGLHWGSEIIWTYGPLGYLSVAYPVSKTLWFLGVIAQTVFTFGLVGMLGVTMRRESSPRWVWVVVSVVLLLNGLNTLLLGGPVLALLLVYAATTVTDRKWATAAAIAGGITLGLLALVKDSFLLLDAAMLLFGVIACLYQGRRRPAWVIPASALLSAGAAWFGSGQGLSDVSPFVRGSLAVALGYGNAMQNGPVDLNAALFALFPLGLGVLAVIAWRAGAARTAVTAGLATLVCFTAFKEGFTRDDGLAGHPQEAFGTFVLALLPVLIAAVSDERAGIRWPRWTPGRPSRAIAVMLTLPLALLIAFEEPPIQTPTHVFSQTKQAARTFFSSTYAAEERAKIDKTIEQDGPLPPPILATVRSHTVDVVPINTADSWAYRLNWDPSPVLLSYSAYTPSLDDLNAAFLAGPRAPHRIIFSIATVDHRFALWDQPKTMRTLLERYKPITPTIDGMVVLAPRRTPVPDHEVNISHSCNRMGHTFAVPQISTSEWMFANVAVGLNVIGRTESLLLRSPALNASVVRADGSNQVFRLLWPVSGNGILLNDTTINPGELPVLFQHGGPVTSRASSVTVGVGVGQSARAFDSQVCVSFFTVKM
jgi:hypothetical protein